MDKGSVKQSNSRLVFKLVGAVAGMFCFGFALVPLYDVICDITGLNGKTEGRYEASLPEDVDTARTVTLQLTASNNADMPWRFFPAEPSLEVHPGEINETYFIAENTTDQLMKAQAVPSIAPSNAVKYLHKTECFCFNQQTLQPGERIEMPLRFFIDENIPDRIPKLTLSYTLFSLPVVAANNTDS